MPGILPFRLIRRVDRQLVPQGGVSCANPRLYLPSQRRSLFSGPGLAQLGTDRPQNEDTTLNINGRWRPDVGIGDLRRPVGRPTPVVPTGEARPARQVRRRRPVFVDGLSPPDLDALVFPGTSPGEKNQLSEGLTFFTLVHTPGEGRARR